MADLFSAGFGYLLNAFPYNFTVFMLARFLEGSGCSALLIAGRAITRDMFSGHELANAASYLSMGFAIGLGAAPLMGGYFFHHFGWQSNFVFLFLFDFCMLLLVQYFLPETLKEKDNKISYQTFLLKKLKNYYTILGHLELLRFSMAGVCAYSVVIAYNIMSPFLMEQVFHLSPQTYGYLALLIGVPYYVAASLNKSIVLKWGVQPSFTVGYSLIIASGLSILVLNYLFPLTLFALMIPMVFASFGQALIFSNSVSSALHLFPAQLGGTVAATLSGLLMILTSLLSAFLALLPHNSSAYIAMVITALGLLALLLLKKEIKL